MQQIARDRTKYKQTGATVAREFLDLLEITLRQSPVPPTHWIYLLPVLVPDTNTAMQRWIEAEITTPNISWNAAKLLFISHYQTADYIDVQRIKFGDCEQGPKESVQHYTDRYATFMQHLGITDSDQTNLLKYMEGLHHDVLGKLYDYRSIMRNVSNAGYQSNPSWDFDTFQLLSAKAISFEAELSLHRDRSSSTKPAPRYDSTSSSSHDRSPSRKHKRKLKGKGNGDKSGSEPSRKRAKGDLFCKNHPDSTSHATKDCKLGASGKGGNVSINPRISISPHTTRVIPPTASKDDTPTCYLCGRPGHIRPNCPENKEKADQRGGKAKHVKARKASVTWDKSSPDRK